MNIKQILSALTAAALSVTAAGTLLRTNAADENGKVRIMPLGDSITDGFTVTGGYRVPLWHMLDDAGLAEKVDFVGPNWGSDGVADPNHAGYSGYSIADIPNQRSGIYNFIDWLMETYPADVVMLQIGTNDILSSYELDTAGERLELLIDSVLEAVPEGGVLYVSTIPYMDADVTTYTDAYTAAEMDAAVDAYNAAVREIVSRKAQEGCPIVQADINAVLTKEDLGDGVHPSESGYRKMAEYWNGVLTGYLTGETAVSTEETGDNETSESTEEPDSTAQPETLPPSETGETVPAEETADSSGTEPDTAVSRPLGDVNGDLEAGVTDIVLLQKVLLGLEKLPDVDAQHYADTTQDNVLDIFDLALLKRMVFTK